MTPVAKRIGTVALMTVVACGVARAQYEIDNPDAFIRRMKETFRTPNTPENIEKLIIYCKQKVMGETMRKRIALARELPALLQQKRVAEVQEHQRLIREINQQAERLREVACKPDQEGPNGKQDASPPAR